MALVSIKKVANYDQALVDGAVTALMGELNVAGKLKPGMKVVLKPNLLTGRKPEQAVTTHPAVVRAVANYLRAEGITDIVLADSPGGPYQRQLLTGIYRACGLMGLSDVLTLNEDIGWTEVKAAPGSTHETFHIINPVHNADFIINIAKMKTHGMTRVSLGIKNLFGAIPGLTKPQLHFENPSHEGFANMLVSLAETVKPNLTVIDAIDCMEGNGPSGGTLKHMGLILGSEDTFNQDYVAAQLMGIEPFNVDMLKVAHERGLIDPGAIKLVGDVVAPANPPFVLPDSHRVDFLGHAPKFLRRPLGALMDRFIKPIPVVIDSKCVGCGKCEESCPQHIIAIREKKAVIARRGCISCFCCQEMCPAKAIKIEKKFRL